MTQVLFSRRSASPAVSSRPGTPGDIEIRPKSGKKSKKKKSASPVPDLEAAHRYAERILDSCMQTHTHTKHAPNTHPTRIQNARF